MKIFELEFDNNELNDFIVNGEANVQMSMPTNKILTNSEVKELEDISSEIASIIRNGFIRFINHKQESEVE